MSKIIVMTYIDNDPISPTYKDELVSHGIDIVTCQTIIFPQEPLIRFPCHYDSELEEYVLNNQ